jgi:hypothetical protein
MTIGVIGAGRLGTAIARQALAAGYDVCVANSRTPDTLTLIIKVLLPGAVARPIDELIARSDIVILALPLNRYKQLPSALFDGKTVVDAMNYWAPTEGTIDEFTDERSSSSQYVQAYLKGARLVKTLNHIAYNELEQHSQTRPGALRRAIVMSGDDQDAKKTVGEFIAAIGFDAVDIGPLTQGHRHQPDTPLFNARFHAKDLSSHGDLVM